MYSNSLLSISSSIPADRGRKKGENEGERKERGRKEREREGEKEGGSE